MNYSLPFIFLYFSFYCLPQNSTPPEIEDALNEFDFIQSKLVHQDDTITYYLKNYKSKPRNLIVFIQGSDPNPIFSYSKEEEKYVIYRWFSDDYLALDSTYAFAIIPKPGLDGIFSDRNLHTPRKYYENNYLDYRVNQLDLSIQDIIQNHLVDSDKIVVYGHSEGAVIGAALATVNKRITHLGFWSGNVLNNFYEFSLFNRIASLRDKISDEEAHESISELLEWYSSISEDPESTEIDRYGFTNKRWSSYEKPPIDYLTQLDIPLYTLFGTEDESTPIETAYLIPIKFIEHRKNNLTFEVCMGCDHSYRLKTEDGHVSQWSEHFKKFIDWVQSN